MMALLLLFAQIFKIGLFSFGGGLATVPFLQELGNSTGWFNTAQLVDMLAVAESLPGAIGIDLAAYVGFWTQGVAGSLVAALGVVAPGTIVILVIANLLSRFKENRYVQALMDGLRPASLALLVMAGLVIFRIVFLREGVPVSYDDIAGFVNWQTLAMFAVLIAVTNLKPFRQVHPIIWIAVCAAIGIAFGL